MNRRLQETAYDRYVLHYRKYLDPLTCPQRFASGGESNGGPRRSRATWWSYRDLNPGPLACHASALAS